MNTPRLIKDLTRLLEAMRDNGRGSSQEDFAVAMLRETKRFARKYEASPEFEAQRQKQAEREAKKARDAELITRFRARTKARHESENGPVA